MKALITGGAGYIGSSIASAMIDKGDTPIILDSLIKGKQEFAANRIFYHGDIADRALLARIFSEHPDIYCTIHCAALAVVSESVEQPYKYYRENVSKSLEFFQALIELGYPHLIFSSSASIYKATPPAFQVQEESPLTASCPYAQTKIMTEQILADLCQASPLQAISLRYFNPIGADPKSRTGPYDKEPTHLLGSLVEVATGRRKVFELNGINWPTRDGSAIRDFIHVWDLASAHLLALEKFDEVIRNDNTGGRSYSVINLGTENGVTVREFVAAFERVLGREIDKVETDPRPGDSAGAYASCAKAQKLLGWQAERTLEEGVADSLAWDSKRASILGY
jgi:UDP-glucose 4-epimerase